MGETLRQPLAPGFEEVDSFASSGTVVESPQIYTGETLTQLVPGLEGGVVWAATKNAWYGGYREALREVQEYVDRIEVPDAPGYGTCQLLVADFKVQLDKMKKG